jgi:hypothetical protein
MNRHERAQLDMFPDSPRAREILANQAVTLRVRIESLLRSLASEIRPCRRCRKTIYFVVQTEKGIHKVVPYDPDGANHFTTCTHPEAFSRAKGGSE